MSEHAQLIDDLGGGTAVAKALGELVGQPIDREAVYKWKENGIPWRWRNGLAALARGRGIAIPSDFLGTDISETKGAATG